MGSQCISCRDFFKFDHLVLCYYSYFVYDDLGGAEWAASASVAGTFLNVTTLFYVITHTLPMMIQEEQNGQPLPAAGTFSEYDHLDIGSYSYFVYEYLGEAGCAATATAAGTFSEFDHLVISSYSYFVCEYLGGAGWAATATAAGTKEPSGAD